MSRISALWTAGSVAVIFALLLGAVLLRPVLSADADVPQTTIQSNVTSDTVNSDEPVYLDSYDDDDDYWSHEELDDHDEHADEDDDDDD